MKSGSGTFKIKGWKLPLIGGKIFIDTDAGKIALNKTAIRKGLIPFCRANKKPHLIRQRNGTTRVALKKRDLKLFKHIFRV